MRRTLRELTPRLSGGAPSFDEFGLHSEACECVRCEAGYRPSPLQRDYARRAAVAKAAAQLAGARKVAKHEAARVVIDSDVEQTRARLARLHAAHAAADADPRSRLFHELRARGLTLPETLAEVDRQFPSEVGDDDGSE